MATRVSPSFNNGFQHLRTTLRQQQPTGEITFPPKHSEPVIVDGVRYDYAEAPPTKEQPYRAAVSATPVDGSRAPRLIAESSPGTYSAHEQVPFDTFIEQFLFGGTKSQAVTMHPPERQRFGRGIAALIERAEKAHIIR